MGRGRGVWFLPRPQLAVLPSSTQSPHPPFEGPWVGGSVFWRDGPLEQGLLALYQLPCSQLSSIH